ARRRPSPPPEHTSRSSSRPSPVLGDRAARAECRTAANGSGRLGHVTPSTAELHEALTAVVADPERISTGDSGRDLHAADLSFHAPHRPDLVVYPTSTEEVAALLALADEHGQPVTPFGAGSSLEGHVIPIAGGISLDLTRMNRILAISPPDLTAVVQ